jgi:predicted CopG family antitoxin
MAIPMNVNEQHNNTKITIKKFPDLLVSGIKFTNEMKTTTETTSAIIMGLISKKKRNLSILNKIALFTYKPSIGKSKKKTYEFQQIEQENKKHRKERVLVQRNQSKR